MIAHKNKKIDDCQATPIINNNNNNNKDIIKYIFKHGQITVSFKLDFCGSSSHPFQVGPEVYSTGTSIAPAGCIVDYTCSSTSEGRGMSPLLTP